jgi:molybdate transport system regulatory protein
MNRLECQIIEIEVSGSMSLITLQLTKNLNLKAIVIETPETADYLVIGNRVNVLFKDTEVVIGTGESHSISLQNRIPGTISDIEHGTLLSRIHIETEVGAVQSVISSDSVSRLHLGKKMPVIAMVKLNEMMVEA